jgi:hypothetical protein
MGCFPYSLPSQNMWKGSDYEKALQRILLGTRAVLHGLSRRPMVAGLSAHVSIASR